MTETDLLIQNLKKQIKLLEQRQNNTLKFIENTCQYDLHLMGYSRGIERKDTGILVYKLTGKNPKDIKRD